MSEMDFSCLTVIHRSKDAAGHGLSAPHEAQLRELGLYLDTCLRQLVILDTATLQALPPRIHDPELQWFSGHAAYSFLLQTATGLNSSIPGETNVLGQFLHAWRSWRAHATDTTSVRIDATLRQLFADSRRIRQDYLQGIGGNSYGSLVRKLLTPENPSRILFVGNGKLAHSMRPMFTAWETGFWNYRSGHERDEDRGHIFGPDQLSEAADWATHMVLTTPATAVTDRFWAQSVRAPQTIVHLGRRRAEPGTWSSLPAGIRYFDLDDVFELRSRQSSVRSLQILRARKACEQQARITAGNSPVPQVRTANACS